MSFFSFSSPKFLQFSILIAIFADEYSHYGIMTITQLKRNLLKINVLPPIGLASILIVALLLLQSCEKEASATAPYADTLQSYYIESTHLGAATADSINTFARKVNALTASWPEVKDEPQYLRIVDNVNHNWLRFSITIDGRWDGIIEINGEE